MSEEAILYDPEAVNADPMDFDQWWYRVGSGIVRGGDDLETHSNRVAWAAWQASQLYQPARKEIALYRDFVDEVARTIKESGEANVKSHLWRAIGWLLFHLKLHRESERVKGERK